MSHFYFTRLNPRRINPVQFCLPALLGIHRNPRHKEFLKSSKGFLRLYSNLSSQISTWTDLRHFWINSNNGTFIAFQMKSFGSKNFKLHAGVKKCHFGNFSDRARMVVLCQYGPQEFLTGFQKFLLLWVPKNSQQYWKAKLERTYSFRVQSGKITV